SPQPAPARRVHDGRERSGVPRRRTPRRRVAGCVLRHHEPLDRRPRYAVPDHDRTQAFARYSLLGALATAAGALAAAAPDLLGALGVGKLTGLTALFYAYAALGV